jgi:hypothetical protein
MVSLFFSIRAASGFYDPTLQRWVNRDPIGERGRINLHLFLRNEPIDAIDFFGLIPFVRKCDPSEMKDCEFKCAPDGVKDCTVTEDYEHIPGKPPKLVSKLINCTCNQPPKPRTVWERCTIWFWKNYRPLIS